MIIVISAIGQKGVIGSDKGLPWKIPEEYNKFLDHVRGNTIIMGRKSWEIFGVDLPDTRFIVVSSRLEPSEGLLVARSVSEAIKIGQKFPQDIFIAGGSRIYHDGIPLADRMYLSFIKKEYSGDVFFPYFNSDEWVTTKTEEYTEFIYKEFTKKT
jgi:dihydrofolate reductase